MYIKLENIQKQYHHKTVLKDVSLTIDQPGIYYIKGKSGSGKTTLLHIIAGFETFEHGKREISPDCRIASIFQSYELIDEFTVRENIEIVKEVFDIHDTHMIEVLGLTPLLDHYPQELSGGQRQRVGILRALLTHPQIILCDEPTVSLDYENRKRVLDLLEELSKESAVLISSHNEQELVSYIDFMYEIKDQHIHLIKEKNTLESLKSIHYSLHMNRLKKYINKMLPTRKRMLIIYLVGLGMIGLFLLQIESQVFHPPIREYARNSHILYITNYTQNTISDTPLVLFEPLFINNKYYQANIYPYIENDDFEDIHLQNNEILINQYLADILSNQSLINQTLTLHYQLGGETYEETFIIKDIIEEKLLDHKPQIYYDYDSFIKKLQTKYHSHQYKTQYDYFMNNSSLYQIQSQNIKEDYKTYEANENISVYNSIYTPYYQKLAHMNIYHMIYLIVMGIIIVVGVMFTLYQHNKYINLMKYRLSLLCSLSLPFSKVKHMYMFQYFQQDLLILSILLIEVIVYELIMKPSVFQCLLLLGFIFLLISIDLGYMLIKMYQYSDKDIAYILKENKN